MVINPAFLCWRKQCFCCCYGLVSFGVLFCFEREREPAPVCSVCHLTWLCVFNYLDYIYLFVNFFRQYIWVIFFHLPYTFVYSPTPPYVPNFMFFVPRYRILESPRSKYISESSLPSLSNSPQPKPGRSGICL